MRPARLFSVIALALSLGLPALLFAQNSKMAVTDLKNVDEDYAIQGEYSGRVVENGSQGWRSKKYGLQVAAQGAGEFIAKLYVGGLPGSGWNRETRLSLAGTREGDAVLLMGEDVQVILKDGKAQLASAERQLVGQLDKVHRESPTLGKKPPQNAVVLFDGEETEYLKGARITEDGLLQEGVELTKLAQDFHLHLEFRLPYMPYARGQGRANSGVYLHKRYEVQVLDSFALDGAFNEAGALYREHKPLLNMVLPPLQWQTYDIAFQAPRFDAEGNKTQNAQVTVLLNGVPVQKNLDLATATGGGKRVGEGPNPLPINLQNHGNPVRFRNIWMVDYTKPEDETQAKVEAPEPVAAKESAGNASAGTEAGNPSTGGSVSSRSQAAATLPNRAMPQAWGGYPFGNFQMDNTFPGGMVPAGVVPYYVPGYYPAPMAWGW